MFADDYFCPGPIQFSGPLADRMSFTLQLEGAVKEHVIYSWAPERVHLHF
jgi:hypothetical protein